MATAHPIATNFPLINYFCYNNNTLKTTLQTYRAHNRGFTLVELIVVLVVLAVMASIAVPALIGYIDMARTNKYITTAETVRMSAESQYSVLSGRGIIKDTSGQVALKKSANPICTIGSDNEISLDGNETVINDYKYRNKILSTSGLTNSSSIGEFSFKSNENGSLYFGFISIDNVWLEYLNGVWSVVDLPHAIEAIDYSKPKSVGKYVFQQVQNIFDAAVVGAEGANKDIQTLMSKQNDYSATLTITLPNGQTVKAVIYNRDYSNFDSLGGRLGQTNVETASFVYNRTTGKISTIVYYDGTNFSSWWITDGEGTNWQSEDNWSDGKYLQKNGSLVSQ